MIHLVHRCGIAGLACTLAILATGTLGAGAQTPLKFTLDWRFEGPAAPFTVALDNGYFNAEGLNVPSIRATAHANRSPGSRRGLTTLARGM